mmetsp:Transcript_23091/g.54888  ORF Transcript_23091/g.54888 Transcript_23091/m.54888 type:complete len:216 (-) Transcript_23091:276-923(-)
MSPADLEWLRVDANDDQLAICAEQLVIRDDGVVSADGVEDDVQRALGARHQLLVCCDQEVASSHRQRRLLLCGRGRQHSHVRTLSNSNFHSHRPEPTQTDDADLGVLSNVVVNDGFIHGDPSAEQWSCSVQRGVLRDLDCKLLVHNHLIAVSSDCRVASLTAPPILAHAAVGRCVAGRAILLLVHLAKLAFLARVYHAADADIVTNLEVRHLTAR